MFEDKNQTWFQSPRSGKFVSNPAKIQARLAFEDKVCFNPLDRGNLYLIGDIILIQNLNLSCFNPLDRGNLYLIEFYERDRFHPELFQSPRSGKFVSNLL